MQINYTKNGNVLLAAVVGRLDSATSNDFMDSLQSNFTSEFTKLTLDFAEVDFMSSKGLRVLVSVYKDLNGREMEIINANTSVKEVFRLSALSSYLNVQ